MLTEYPCAAVRGFTFSFAPALIPAASSRRSVRASRSSTLSMTKVPALDDVGEPDGCLLRHLAFHGGDEVAVRVDLGVAEFGGDALFEALGDEVLEAFCLFVDLFDGVVEDLVEEGLDEAVVAHDFERAAFAGG